MELKRDEIKNEFIKAYQAHYGLQDIPYESLGVDDIKAIDLSVTLYKDVIDRQNRSLLEHFITWFNAIPKIDKPQNGMVTIGYVNKFMEK